MPLFQIQPKNGPTSRATEAEISRTVSVPAQQSRSVELSTQRSRNRSRSSSVSTDESRPKRERAHSISHEARKESSVEHVRPEPNIEGVDLHMHKDGDEAPQWARYVVESQLNSEARLINLESEIRKATRGRKENDAREYVFEKKLCKVKDQYDFNKNVFELLDHALHLVFEPVEDSECGDLIREGMNLLKNRNKHCEVL